MAFARHRSGCAPPGDGRNWITTALFSRHPVYDEEESVVGKVRGACRSSAGATALSCPDFSARGCARAKASIGHEVCVLAWIGRVALSGAREDESLQPCRRQEAVVRMPSDVGQSRPTRPALNRTAIRADRRVCEVVRDEGSVSAPKKPIVTGTRATLEICEMASLRELRGAGQCTNSSPTRHHLA